MAIVMNLVALALVVVFCWFGMHWFGPAMHRMLGGHREEQFEEPTVVEVPRDEPCAHCDGVGALRGVGRLHPCPVCEGTGVGVRQP